MLLAAARSAARPPPKAAATALTAWLEGRACRVRAAEYASNIGCHGWPLAYALAWISVAGGKSAMPPWVMHEWPEARRIARALRATACTDRDCEWCREHHDASRQLKRWFGFERFREQPEGADGRPVQQAITEAALAREHSLGILPTGVGKSVCYQLPALTRHEQHGALTVVISPLVALMADQVAGLEARGIEGAVTINGMLSQPERADALDRVRLGEAAIVLTSPEQLRSRTVRRTLAQREIAGWVVDEAHCISQWGHDFRPDYRYIGRVIREHAGDEEPPPVLCLTATAKLEVQQDIIKYFRDTLDIELTVFDGGSQRTNLEFVVIRVAAAAKAGPDPGAARDHASPGHTGRGNRLLRDAP